MSGNVSDISLVPSVSESARETFIRQVLDRTPLANVVLSLQAYVLAPTLLDDLFDRYRGQNYQDLLTFPTLVQILADALQRYRGSARQSLLQAEKERTLLTTPRAFYGKLSRVPLELSQALVATTEVRLRELLPPIEAQSLPPSVKGLQVYMLDGKKTKRVAKRLRATRGQAGQLFGGKLLVAWQPRTGLVLAMAAHPDGEKNDCPLVPALLPQVRHVLAGPRLAVADRQFCDLVPMQRFTEGNDHFLIRYHPKVHFHADPARPAKESQDRQGRTVVDEWGWLGAANHPGRRYVRRITLNRAGEEDVSLVTDLLDDAAYPANDLLDVYLIRWGIERVFQKITEVFGLQQLISSTPEGTVFQAAFCLVLYNMIQVIRGYVATLQDEPLAVEDVSTEMLFRDVRDQLSALMLMAEPDELISRIPQTRTKEQMVALLTGTLRNRWERSWRKAVNKKPRPRVAQAKGSGAHTSVHRLQEKHRREHGSARRQP
jgi:hypothetical protein